MLSPGIRSTRFEPERSGVGSGSRLLSVKALILLLAMTVPHLPAGAAVTGSEERLRVIVETDAGGDPDDEQSLVRFLLYSNEWDVEGIIANRPIAREGENRNPERTGPGIVRRVVQAYGAVEPTLRQHAPGYPAGSLLLERTVSGCADSNAGVKLVIAAVDSDDPRPVWFMNWGTDHGCDPSSLQRALDQVLEVRGPEGYARFKSRILLSSDDRFGDHTRTGPPWTLWVQPSRPKLDGAFMYHRFGPLTATAGGFDIERDVRTGHGPLGALYPVNTNIPQKEGDSGYFLYLVPTGMNDPMHPEWGSWAGRFGLREDPIAPDARWYWANVRDTWKGSTSRDNVLRRWAADLQNDFRARMDWCVRPFSQANHPPAALVNGRPGREIIRLRAAPGSSVALDASGSTDPDGDELTFHWEVYSEAGTCRTVPEMEGADSPSALLTVPEEEGAELHILLTVRDGGDPPLAAWRRVIVEITGRP